METREQGMRKGEETKEFEGSGGSATEEIHEVFSRREMEKKE